MFCLLLIFLFFPFFSLLFSSLPSLPSSSIPHPPPPFLFFFFLFVTGLYFYPHPPFREFLKLYFPPYQRGLRLKKPMVPPQSLTLVSSNTSKLLPTCSYSSIQPFSHQVSASLAAFQGRQRGDCGTSTVGGSCWWQRWCVLEVMGARHRQLLQPWHSSPPCPWAQEGLPVGALASLCSSQKLGGCFPV